MSEKRVPRRTWNQCLIYFIAKGWPVVDVSPSLTFRHPVTGRQVWRDMPLTEFRAIVAGKVIADESED